MKAASGDSALIVQLVGRLERAQQAEDVDAFLRLFGSEPLWVTGHGVRLVGFDAISEFTQRVLPGAMTESTARYDVVHTAFLRHDVAVVSVDQTPITLAGEPLSGEPQGRPLYVVVKQGGEWLIRAAQNTQARTSSA